MPKPAQSNKLKDILHSKPAHMPAKDFLLQQKLKSIGTGQFLMSLCSSGDCVCQMLAALR